MSIYILRITVGNNRFWNKYITYGYRLRINNEDIKFHKFKDSKIKGDLHICALSNMGAIIREESYYRALKKPKKMSEFNFVESLIIIKNDILNTEVFKDIKGVTFLDVAVEGDFSQGYKLLNFDKVEECVNRTLSVREEFDHYSTLVLDKTKVPKDVDGFFLKGWCEYDKYEPIVNENIKSALLKLPMADKFLEFDELQVE